MSHRVLRILGPVAAAATLFAWSPVTPTIAAQAGTYTATASVKTDAGTRTAPVTVVITRTTTDQERTTVADALKKGGSPAVLQALKTMGDAGYIEVADRKTTLKYAYVRAIGGGRLITVIAPTPIVHLGANLPDAKPKTGFDLSLALLQVMDAGPGTGELAPAATVKLTDTGAIQTQDYGTDVVMLTNVQIKK